ncbi:hypothetical protein GCM10023231_41950 [Olivibacter ginsenosidimutans]|uniref:DUF3300 domain-containing protein n=1 Tax=Olivibacter ginsenosidimutans TaxID=1176537 RepID=A0ABP9CCE1_9SPHI
MKKILFLSVISLAGLLPTRSSAQVQFSINIGLQPDWGPTGYDHVDYYYLPEIESYYYVPTRQFVYLSNGSWIFSLNLPPRYRHYDLYRGYKVVMNSPHPYYHFKQHRYHYRDYRGYRVQRYIGHRSRPTSYHGRSYARPNYRVMDRSDHRFRKSQHHPKRSFFANKGHSHQNRYRGRGHH